MINTLLEKISQSLGIEEWMAQIITIVFITAIINFVIKLTVFYLKKISNKTSNHWDDAVAIAINPPLVVALWSFAGKFSVDVLSNKFSQKIYDEDQKVLQAVVVLAISWFLARLINFASQNIVAKKIRNGDNFDHTTIDAITKLLRLTVFVLAILIIVQNLGFSVSGVLAAGGMGGLVLGFAAKDMLANFFGGLTIYLDRPFSVGDWIRCSEKDIEGTVEYIGWRHTRVRAFNKNPIYVPNAIFTTIVVENPSRMTNRRMREFIGLRYCDMAKMKVITSQVRQLLEGHKDIDHEQSVVVNFTSFGASSIDFIVNCYTKTVDWKEFCEVKQDIMLGIADIIAKNGGDIAFPTRTLYMEGGDEKSGKGDK